MLTVSRNLLQPSEVSWQWDIIRNQVWMTVSCSQWENVIFCVPRPYFLGHFLWPRFFLILCLLCTSCPLSKERCFSRYPISVGDCCTLLVPFKSYTLHKHKPLDGCLKLRLTSYDRLKGHVKLELHVGRTLPSHSPLSPHGKCVSGLPATYGWSWGFHRAEINKYGLCTCDWPRPPDCVQTQPVLTDENPRQHLEWEFSRPIGPSWLKPKTTLGVRLQSAQWP